MKQSAPTVPAPLEGATPPGRAPVQQRSRERLELLAGVAAALIAERGSDAMRMSDVAQRAGVSIGSLYQYFPDKAAILRTLAERYNAEGRACIEAELAGAQDLPGLREAFGRLIDTYYALFLAEPVIRDIWLGRRASRGCANWSSRTAGPTPSCWRRPWCACARTRPAPSWRCRPSW